MKFNKRIVLAYSGGLDTSIILKWLQENYNAEIIAYTADIGQKIDRKKIYKNAKKLGVKKIIIEDLKDTFVKEVESLGAEVVSVVPYERSQTDFKKQILEIGGIDDDKLKKMVEDQLETNTASAPLGQNGPMSRPVVEMGLWSDEEVESLKVSLELSYDAIFLPGFYDKVGLIVPQLVFYNVDAAALLGADGWNSPELVKIAGNYMRKGYFVNGFYAKSKRTEVVQFVKQYKSYFAEEPTILSAQSYDVANMFVQSIKSGATNRRQIREKLIGIRGFQGVSGRTNILPNGESDKNLFIMKIIKKKITEDN